MAGSINLLVCRVPFGTHLSAIDSHRTAPTACTVLFISHPFGVIYRSPLIFAKVRKRGGVFFISSKKRCNFVT